MSTATRSSRSKTSPTALKFAPRQSLITESSITSSSPANTNATQSSILRNPLLATPRYASHAEVFYARAYTPPNPPQPGYPVYPTPDVQSKYYPTVFVDGPRMPNQSRSSISGSSSASGSQHDEAGNYATDEMVNDMIRTQTGYVASAPNQAALGPYDGGTPASETAASPPTVQSSPLSETLHDHGNNYYIPAPQYNAFSTHPALAFVQPPLNLSSPVLVTPRPASDYAKMDSPTPPPSSASLRTYVSRLARLWQTFISLPWVASERITVDYYPAKHRRRERRRQSSLLSSQMTDTSSRDRRHRASISWYNRNAHPLQPPPGGDIDLLSSGGGTPPPRRGHQIMVSNTANPGWSIPVAAVAYRPHDGEAVGMGGVPHGMVPAAAVYLAPTTRSQPVQQGAPRHGIVIPSMEEVRKNPSKYIAGNKTYAYPLVVPT